MCCQIQIIVDKWMLVVCGICTICSHLDRLYKLDYDP
uniref:Uncharacterized protein n=1 Tax=Setaria viridis TaxID=4556 RepID=A0A4U6TEM4_SETVI|nr:hypothetical protein SEVIR_8G125550v2 [Setaria viridis]